jgi:5-methylcytosine-specific restriction enzyme subunit McrC
MAVAADLITLSEYEWKPVELVDEDAVFIAKELSPKLAITKRVGDDRYWANPNQHVGIVALPSGARLESYPKVPVRNLFYMLAVAIDYPKPFREGLAEFERLERLLEFVAEFFADLVEDRIRKGLYRSYVEREENLPFVRGRIDHYRDVRENYILRHRTFCRHAELTWDILENQLIRQAAYMLTGWEFRPQLRTRLSSIDATLHEVTPTAYPASVVNRLQYHRLNEDYRELHRLCRLFLEDASLSEELGTFGFRTFLLDMNLIFEMFVTRVLEVRAPLGVDLQAQEGMHLDYGRRVGIRPDFLVQAAGRVLAAADCKYKRISSDEYKNHDVYQVLAYCLAAGTDRGLLIYPRHTVDIDDSIQVLNTAVEIRRLSIDLGKCWDELELECDAIAQKVFGWAAAETKRVAA